MRDREGQGRRFEDLQDGRLAVHAGAVIAAYRRPEYGPVGWNCHQVEGAVDDISSGPIDVRPRRARPRQERHVIISSLSRDVHDFTIAVGRPRHQSGALTRDYPGKRSTLHVRDTSRALPNGCAEQQSQQIGRGRSAVPDGQLPQGPAQGRAPGEQPDDRTGAQEGQAD